MREKLLMDRIILGVKSEKTRGKLISQSKLDLRKAIAICRADEAAGEQMKAMNPKAKRRDPPNDWKASPSHSKT